MPMDPAYEELELDIVEEHGGGRVWQEMAKNPALPGENIVSSHPGGLHPNQIKHKEEKTLRRIGVRRTQVLRRGKEG